MECIEGDEARDVRRGSLSFETVSGIVGMWIDK